MRAPAPISWHLQLPQPGLEEAFWETSEDLRRYHRTVDIISAFTITISNVLALVLVRADVLRGYGGWGRYAAIWPLANILIAYAQNIARVCIPAAYWKHRNVISQLNILQRVVLTGLMSSNVESWRNKIVQQLTKRPAWTVVLTTLAASGPLMQVIENAHFPLSFKSTILLQGVNLVAHIKAFTPGARYAMDHPPLQRGLLSACSAVHQVLGSSALLSSNVISGRIQRCGADSRWMISFVQLSGYALVVCHAYLSERGFKVSFLREKGFAAGALRVHERVFLVWAFLIAAYIGAQYLQVVYDSCVGMNLCT